MAFIPVFHFVREKGNSEPGDNHGSVRQHAQRQAWRRRRLEAIQRLKPDNGSSLGHRLRQSASEETWSHAAYQSPVFDSLGSGNFDPFDSAVVKIDAVLHQHIVFFATSMWSSCSRECRPEKFLSTFGNIAVHDEGVLYAIAASSAARRCSKERLLPQISRGTRFVKPQLLYTTLTARRIRENLNHLDNSDSEATVGCIAFLAMFEAVDNGNLDLSVMHISAIRRIIEYKGGYKSLSWLWTERILAADVKAACVGLSRPLLPILPGAESSRQIRIILGDHHSNLASCFNAKSADRLISPFCEQLIGEIRDLILFTLAYPSKANDASSDVLAGSSLFQHQRLALEQELLEYMSDPCTDISSFEACVHIGLLLFINTAFWIHFESSCAILTNLCHHLQQRWKKLDFEETNFTATEPWIIEIWLLFVGAHASRGASCYSWFVEMLREMVPHLAIHGRSEFKEALLQCLYIDSIFEETLQIISAEIFQNDVLSMVNNPG